MEKLNLQPVFIAGPTASGKSELALRLADRIDSVIISADSMQIYKGLNIGTAKVSEQIRNKYEHKLIDIVNADEEFSVARFAELAQNEIESALRRKKLPIVVGGTGLYFEALLHPMSFGNTVKNEALRANLQAEYDKNGAAALHDKLFQLDKETANRIHPNDAKRVIRALEIIMTTGKTLKDNEDERIKSDNIIMVAFDDERDQLYARINARVDEMLDEGLAMEALSVGSFDYQSMQAIGYKEFANCKYVIENGEYVFDKDELQRISEEIKKHTRNYAKRQLTWFRRYKFIKWFKCGDFDGAINYIKSRLCE